MGLLVALALAILILDEPWTWIVVALGATWEIAETVLLIRWSQRREAAVGAGALVGRQGVVAADCMPLGQIRIAGELWGARCEVGAGAGDEVVVRGVDGLTLVVEAVS
ncbi:MAG TPA: NfeD family protein [Gaiellaceae bacterium]|nr:NfeD family protein [Gaiellaceae bacterium]